MFTSRKRPEYVDDVADKVEQAPRKVAPLGGRISRR